MKIYTYRTKYKNYIAETWHNDTLYHTVADTRDIAIKELLAHNIFKN